MVNQSRKFDRLEKAVVIEMDKQPGRQATYGLLIFFYRRLPRNENYGINC